MNSDGKIYDDSEVQKFYANATVFITGGSGLLGTLIIEKLLRNCPTILKIYVLLRAKRNKTYEERKKELFENEIYDRVRNCKEDLLNKITILNGDCLLPELGLSLKDKNKLIDEVNIVFHAAATVKFDEKLSKAIPINVRGTRDLLQMCSKMVQLKSVVHVSTAYSFCINKEIDERVYEMHISAAKLINMYELLNETELESLNKQVLGEFPNTYALTKAAAENYVKEMSKELPIAIIRPSVVVSTAKEPIPGWINNLHGITGIATGCAVGLLRTLHCNMDEIIDLVPADYVINFILVAATKVSHPKKNDSEKTSTSNRKVDENVESKDVQVYNFVGSNEWSITNEKFMVLMQNHGFQVPSLACMWYFFFIMNRNKFINEFCYIFLHYIPAYIIDGIAILTGKKPQLVAGYNKIKEFLKPTAYFTTRSWKFSNKNVLNIWNNINERDQELFPFDMKLLNWDSYMYDYVRGIRKYLLKDPMDTVPEGKRKYFKLKVAHYTILSLLTLIFGYLFFVIFNLIFTFY